MLISHVDLNLLRPLRALLEEKSVTRAAARLDVAQPTMSIALSRLRVHFDDPLLVRSGNSYELTPLAARLRDTLPAVVGDVERVFQAKSTFDPADSDRVFVIAGIDYAITRIAPALDSITAAEAPNVRFEFPAADSRLVNDAPRSLRSVDGLILPHGYLTDQPHLELMSDTWVCIVDVKSALADPASAEELLARPWVHTLAARDGMTPAGRQLQIQGVDVRIAAITPNFHVIPSLVEGTDRVALLPRSLARRIAGEGARVRVVEPPFALDSVHDAFWWHRDRQHDAEHAWLRGVLERVRASIIADR
jgi:DNA-binding transcriptional LysR family regulator